MIFQTGSQLRSVPYMRRGCELVRNGRIGKLHRIRAVFHIAPSIGPDEFHLPDVNDHRGNLLGCVKTRAQPLAPVEEAHRSATICHVGNIAMKRCRRVRWDPAAGQFLDDAEANRMLSRSMRSPYTLKERAQSGADLKRYLQVVTSGSRSDLAEFVWVSSQTSPAHRDQSQIVKQHSHRRSFLTVTPLSPRACTAKPLLGGIMTYSLASCLQSFEPQDLVPQDLVSLSR